mgnify:FL=1|tara:strand:- start:226 stop:813 length:588 start_codon:yes stop_codon:yes gene_type:complete
MALSTIGTNALAANAVTSAKITDGTIATGDIADDAITAAKVDPTSVGSEALSSLTVDSIIINGTNIGHTSDTDAISIASSGVTTFSAAVVGATDTDTSNTGSVTLDFAANQNFVLTFTGNVTLANPSTEAVGQSGIIVCIQDGTGSRTLSLGTDYETAGGAGITLSTAASAVDVIPYFVKASGSIQLGAVQKAFA